MKKFRAMGQALFVVLVLAAVPSVASASSGVFTAGKYPAILTGEATGEQGKLETALGTSLCTSPTLTATLSKPSEASSTAVTYKGSCSASLNANGCEFTFHPPTEGINGTFDIGGSKCSGITGAVPSKIKILPQSGLAATFENVGAGSSATVKITAKAVGLKYEVLEGAYKGSYSNGSYTTAWSVRGESAGAATGVSVAPYPGFSVIGGGSAAEFHSDLYPATISGQQTKGVIGGTTIETIRVKTVAGNLTCSTATFSSSSWAPEGLIGDTAELLMAPTASGCKLGGQAVTVTPKAGCNYNFVLTGSAPYAGSLFLCQTEIASSTGCTVTLSSQTRSGVEYANLGAGSSKTVEAKANLSAVEYQVAGGSKCPNEPANGSYNTGKYEGVISLGVAKVG